MIETDCEKDFSVFLTPWISIRSFMFKNNIFSMVCQKFVYMQREIFTTEGLSKDMILCYDISTYISSHQIRFIIKSHQKSHQNDSDNKKETKSAVLCCLI